MLSVLLWKWGTKYPARYVNTMARMVCRNLRLDHEIVCITDDPGGIDSDIRVLPIWSDLPYTAVGCFGRLIAFSKRFADILGNDRFVSMDVDCVVTGDLTPLFDVPDDLRLASGIHYIPCRYNGSMFLHRCGTRPRIFDRFSAERIGEWGYTPSGVKLGTDQAWIAHASPNEPVWTPADGVYGFNKPGWPRDGRLPANARVIFFPGSADPESPDVLHANPWIEDFRR